MEIIGNAQKAHKKYICEKCDFVCSYLRDWNRHITRPKHQNNDFGNDFEKKAHKKAQIVKEYICNCGKKYNTNSGLWKHQKKCDDYSSETNVNVVSDKTNICDKEWYQCE